MSRRVLFVATVESHLLNFHKPYMQLLAQKGFEVHAAAKLGRRCKEFEEIGVTAHNIDFSRSPYSPKVLTSLLQMVKLLKNQNYALVHVHTPVAAFVTRLACTIADTHPVLYTAHGFHFYKGAPLKNWLLYYPMERLAAHWTDGLITINQEDYQIAQRFKLRNGGKVFYVPGVGADVQEVAKRANNVARNEYRAKLQIEESSLVITTVAELSGVKNHEQALRAISQLDDLPITYVVVGEGEREAQLKNFVKKLGLGNKTRFLGFRKDVPEILGISDLFLLTSRREGLPKAVLEAMAASLPIVATDVRGNRDLIKHGENGYLVKVDDVPGTAQAVKNLAKDPRLRSYMGKRSLELVQTFSLDKVLPLMARIYDFYLNRAT